MVNFLSQHCCLVIIMMIISIRYYPGAPSSISVTFPHTAHMVWTGNSSLVVVFYVLLFFYSSEYTTNLSILRISLISCYHSCLLCKRIWRLIYNANCQLNCCDQIWDLQTITCRYEENYRYLKLPLRITLHQITNGFPHCGLTALLVYDYVYNIYIYIYRFDSTYNFISR